MARGQDRQRRLRGAVWLVFVASLYPATSRAAAPLAEDERLAYARWLGATAALPASEASSPAPGDLLFPTLVPAGESGPPPLASARALLAREAAKPARRAPAPRSADALAVARAYRVLGEYRKALGWFGTAQAAGDSSALPMAAAREALGAAAALGDSQSVVRDFAGGLDDAALTSREDEVVLAFRFLLARTDSVSLTRLIARVDASTRALPPRVRFWRAFAAVQTGDWESALAGARALVSEGDSSRSLDPFARLWLAGALPDLLTLVGLRGEASELYRQLAASGLEPLGPWAHYQLASLDLLAGRYAAAGDGLRTLCAATEPWPWRERACALAALADTLTDLTGGGGGHGVVAAAGH